MDRQAGWMTGGQDFDLSKVTSLSFDDAYDIAVALSGEGRLDRAHYDEIVSRLDEERQPMLGMALTRKGITVDEPTTHRETVDARNPGMHGPEKYDSHTKLRDYMRRKRLLDRVHDLYDGIPQKAFDRITADAHPDVRAQLVNTLQPKVKAPRTKPYKPTSPSSDEPEKYQKKLKKEVGEIFGLRVGAPVRHPGLGIEGTLVLLEDGHALVRDAKGGLYTFAGSELEG